jgi:beta-lactamase regulating signal transducer with metallopeptidase domain
MIAYIVRTILCSGLLILIYHLLLERERIYKFNRGYLLFSIVFSFIIPLISIKVRSSVGLIPETFYQINSIVHNTVPQQPLPYVTDGITLTQLLLLVYIAVTAFFFIRFFTNLFSLVNKIKHSSSVPYNDAKFVLTKDTPVPYSFLKYVFIHYKDFARGKIESEILSHELTHVRQKHSIDILFIELLLIFAWINPLLFLYRRAIHLNHEFLADDYVVKKFNDAKTYQLLLIGKVCQTNRLLLSSQFNYLLTKKRIVMMSKQASLRVAILKQIALLPVIVAAVFLFTTKVIAQGTETTLNQQQIELTQSGAVSSLNQQDTDFENWWKSIAQKHGINNDSFTVHEPFVIFGKKTFKNNIESFNDVVVIAKGIGFKKGENIYSIIKSDNATYGYDATLKGVALNINNCVIEQFDSKSNSTEPTESRTLKTFGADMAGYQSK